jgi:phosphoadenosine phosphosulfate reductase
MVTLSLVLSVKPDVPVFSVMSDTEFPETYAFAKEMVKKYKLNYREYIFHNVPGDVLKCCGNQKVEKTKEAVANLDAWISGVRKTEGITRANFQPVEEKNGLTKINPILEFTELDIWRYIALNELPINPKYKEGYRSLGCANCSFKETNENESERSGRWKGTDRECGECGIHSQPLR